MGAQRRVATWIVAGVLVLSACSSSRENAGADTSDTPQTGLAVLTQPPTAPPPVTTTPSRPRRTTTTTAAPRRTTTTTTTLVPVRSAANPRCVVRIRDGDSLFAIAEAAGQRAVTITSLARENRIRNPDRIEVGDLLDICVRNGINDITGKKRVPPARQRATPRTTVPG